MCGDLLVSKRQLNFSFHKQHGIFWPTDQPPASQQFSVGNQPVQARGVLLAQRSPWILEAEG